jgi:ribosomal protein L7/L12
MDILRGADYWRTHAEAEGEAAEPLFQVVIVGYRGRDREEAATALAQAFGLALDAARELVGRAPVVVKSAVREDVARQYREVLLRTGAEVELRPMARAASPAAPASATPPAPRRGAITVNVPVEPPASLPERRAPETGSGIGSSMLLPFRGSGWKWLLGGGAYSVASATVIRVLDSPAVAGVCALLFGAGLIAIAAAFHHACLWGALRGEREPSATGDPEGDVVDRWVTPGLRFGLFALLLYVLPGIWLHGRLDGAAAAEVAGDPWTWVVMLAPALCWPLSVAIAGVRGSVVELFNVVIAAKLVARVPLQVVFLWVVTGLALATIPLAVLSVAGLSGRLDSLAPFLVGPSFLVAHGIHGALCGWLARTREDVFA